MLNKILFKDSSGKKSLTATAFIWGFLVVNVKLIFSGVTLAEGVVLAPFTGAEYGIAISALGAIYVLRRNQTAGNNASKAESTSE